MNYLAQFLLVFSDTVKRQSIERGDMQGLSEQQLLLALVALAVILLVARGAGEIARRLRQPEVLGEFFAGFLLGPSVLGALLPGMYHALFLNGAVSFVLSGFSWVGAILLLLIAGIEVDLAILRAEAKPGVLAAVLAILPSLVAGALFGLTILHAPIPNSIFLGIVLSVTAVSIVAKIFIEREVLRRRYAQVALAAGIVGEVLAWLLVSIVSATRSSTPLLDVARSAFFAIAFFIFMLTLGRHFTFWAMRRVADSTRIINGQISLVLVLMLLSAGLTQALGLHALLGAFVFGVLLSRAPRTTQPLLKNVQTLTTGLFAPIFFVLAGMRVDILQLRSASAIAIVILLLLVATIVKVGLGTLGARLGGLRTAEATLVGIGLNLKGGTDVIVAIIGAELGLLTSRTYTMYAVVAFLTVIISPLAITYLEQRAQPAGDELDRLEMEEAQRRAYVPHLEKVLLPIAHRLIPALAASVVERIALSKHQQKQLFDITQLVLDERQAIASEVMAPAVVLHEDGAFSLETQAAKVRDHLEGVSGLERVEVVRRRGAARDNTLDTILAASQTHDLIAIGAHPQKQRRLSFGQLQDEIIHRAKSDVLVVTGEPKGFEKTEVRRILVATNGLEYSQAAGDLAASLAQAFDAELVLFHAVYSEMDTFFWRERDRRALRTAAYGVVDELAFRIQRLGVRTTERVRVAERPGDEIVRELKRESYQLVVLGAFDRSASRHPYLGRAVETVLTRGRTPAVVLVSRAGANSRHIR